MIKIMDAKMGKNKYLILVYFLIVNSIFGQINNVPDLFSDGNVVKILRQTESGTFQFIANAGLIEGANNEEIFGINKPTTLWNDRRRLDCYEKSIRIAAQMPVLSEDYRYEQYFLETISKLGVANDVLLKLTDALNSLHSNFVDGSTLSGLLNNKISDALRTINPKTLNGIRIVPRNLESLGNWLKGFSYAKKIFDFSIGAAIEEALSGDIALGRVQIIRESLISAKNSNMNVDPLIFKAIDNAEKNLVRSEDYWGALITELCDRKSELVKIGVEIGIELVKKDAVKLLTSYYQNYTGLGLKTATTKASTVAGLWGFSLMITYSTIVALLDQHKQGQISVTSATIAQLLDWKLNNYSNADDQVLAVKLQLEFDYYDKMVNICSDLLSVFHDLVTSIFQKGRPYKEAKNYFSELRQEVNNRILSLIFKDEEILLGFVLDASGSMSSNDPQDMRKSAVEMIINELNGNENIYIVEFSDNANWLNSNNYENYNKDLLKGNVRSVNSNGISTNIGSSLITMQKAIESTGKKDNDGGIILLTDGKNSNQFDFSLLDWFKQNDIPISTISFVGDVDNKLLSDIASITGGNYFRATNTYDVVMYFREFLNSVSSNSSLTFFRNMIQQGESQSFSFYVDNAMSFIYAGTNWSGSKIRLKLISPSNKIYNENDNSGEWYTGSNYSSVKLSNPESGKWKAEFYGESIPSGGEEYVFQVNGDSPNKITLDDKLLISGQMQFSLDNSSRSNFSDIKSKIEVTTPKNKKEDISKNFSKDGFTYRPRDGEGNYNFEINLTGKDKSGSIMQRYFTRTILVGEGSASNIALVKLIEGNYLYADLGKDIGNFPGLECTIYSQNGNIPIASGYVTFVSETECSIEIQNMLSDQSINLGDTVELNVTQWQQDY